MLLKGIRRPLKDPYGGESLFVHNYFLRIINVLRLHTEEVFYYIQHIIYIFVHLFIYFMSSAIIRINLKKGGDHT